MRATVAENEVLYVSGGRFWKRVRYAIEVGAPAEAVAERAAEGLMHAVRSTLRTEGTKRQNTLHSLLAAASVGEEGLRNCLSSFEDRQFASLIVCAIRKRGLIDKNGVAEYASELLIDRAAEALYVHIHRHAAIQGERAVEDLKATISDRLAQCKYELSGVLGHSLGGKQVSAPRSKVNRASREKRVREVAATSLVSPVAREHAKRH